MTTSSENESGRLPVASITHYLFGLILAVVLPLLLLLGLLSIYYVSAERKVVEAQRFDVTNNLTALIDHEIDSAKSLLLALAASPDLAAGRIEVFEHHATAAAKSAGIGVIVLSDQSGSQIRSSPDAAAAVQRVAITDIGKVYSGQSVVSGAHEQAPSFHVSVPVVVDGVVRYAITAQISVDRLTRVFSDARLRPEWIGAIIDSNGLILARSRGNGEFRGRPARIQAVDAARGRELEGEFENVSLDGLATSNWFQKSQSAGWTSLVAVSLTVLNAPRDRALKMMGLGHLQR